MIKKSILTVVGAGPTVLLVMEVCFTEQLLLQLT